jgi:hypothetical protein
MEAGQVWVRHPHAKDPQVFAPEDSQEQGQQGQAPSSAADHAACRTEGEGGAISEARGNQAGTT